MARAHLVDPAVTRWYHCITRCVRSRFCLVRATEPVAAKIGSSIASKNLRESCAGRRLLGDGQSSARAGAPRPRHGQGLVSAAQFQMDRAFAVSHPRTASGEPSRQIASTNPDIGVRQYLSSQITNRQGERSVRPWCCSAMTWSIWKGRTSSDCGSRQYSQALRARSQTKRFERLVHRVRRQGKRARPKRSEPWRGSN